jgi:hypothetical protein
MTKTILHPQPGIARRLLARLKHHRNRKANFIPAAKANQFKPGIFMIKSKGE